MLLLIVILIVITFGKIQAHTKIIDTCFSLFFPFSHFFVGKSKKIWMVHSLKPLKKQLDLQMKLHSRKKERGELQMRYFKGKQFKQDIILVAVGYYCRFSLSYRGISVHPTTVMRWIYEYGNLIYQIGEKKNKNVPLAWKLDETYIKMKRK